MTTTSSIDKLLRDRERHLAAIAAIDAALAARGVRLAAKVPDGHARTTSVGLLTAIGLGAETPAEIAKRTGQTPHAVSQMLYDMLKSGEVVRVAHGRYALPATPSERVKRR
ncbi:MAG: hypothetical protein ACHREM_04185 [Polyangiales bacterium]